MRLGAARPAVTIAAAALLLAGCPESGGDAGSALIRGLDPPEALVRDGDDLGYVAEVNSRIEGLDLDGDGRQELAIASARELAIVRVAPDGAASVVWRAPSLGGATAIAAGDLDGDGRDDLAVGWGTHRDHLEAPAQLAVYRSAGAAPGSLIREIVATPSTPRAQFSTLRVADTGGAQRRGLLFGHFASKYGVRVASAAVSKDGTWTIRELHSIRMGAEAASARLRPGDAGPSLLVGRPYGDEVKSEGDIFLLESSGERIALPHVRGVRSLRVLEGLGPEPGRPLVCYGDGWHWRYKARGKGWVTCAWRRDDGEFDGGRLAELPEYSVGDIRTADLDGDGSAEIVALGADSVWALSKESEADGSTTWRPRRIGRGGYALAVLDTDGDGIDEVALAGDKPRLLRIR